MINSHMKEYNYYLFDENNAYGQKTLLKDENGEPVIQGTVKLSIHNTSNTIQDNLLYAGATYIGLTFNKAISDNYVVQYGNEKLKVLYVIPSNRYQQVFMNSYE